MIVKTAYGAFVPKEWYSLLEDGKAYNVPELTRIHVGWCFVEGNMIEPINPDLCKDWRGWFELKECFSDGGVYYAGMYGCEPYFEKARYEHT